MPAQAKLPKVISDLLQESKTAAQERNHDAALEAVNNALKVADKKKLVPTLVISLLDHRHAIHVQRDNLDSALKDAKSMIRLDHKDARGYLRCGRVETLRGQPAAAVKYFEHGLRNVSASDPNMASLTRKMKKTQDQILADLVVSRARDPMTTLPLEVVEIVLSYLDYRQHVQLLGISRSWKRILCAMPPLTDTLAFPGAQKLITPKMLLAALRRLTVPRFLSASNLTQPAENILADRLQRSQAFRSLYSLEIQSPFMEVDILPLTHWSFLRTINVSGTKIGWVGKLLESCPDLEVARFRIVNRPRETLKLSSQSLQELELTTSEFRLFVLDLPQITRLSLSRCTPQAETLQPGDRMKTSDLQHLTKLESLSMEHSNMFDILLPPQIRHLKLRECKFLPVETGPLTSAPSTTFPSLDSLESLDLLDTAATIIDRISREPYPLFIRHAAMNTNPGTMTSLAISQNRAWPANLVSTISSPWFNSLKSLRIQGSEIKDEHAQVVLLNCPDLETLFISEASITGVFVSDLIKAPTSRLCCVTIDKCHKVGRDIVRWAEERGVEVQYITQFDNVTGRRIREGM